MSYNWGKHFTRPYNKNIQTLIDCDDRLIQLIIAMLGNCELTINNKRRGAGLNTGPYGRYEKVSYSQAAILTHMKNVEQIGGNFETGDENYIYYNRGCSNKMLLIESVRI